MRPAQSGMVIPSSPLETQYRVLRLYRVWHCGPRRDPGWIRIRFCGTCGSAHTDALFPFANFLASRHGFEPRTSRDGRPTVLLSPRL